MTESKGIKVLELVPKRQDISDERFHYHWNVLHTRVSQRVEPMKRYVQNHRITPGLPGMPSLPLEGVTEAWFDDLAGVHDGLNHPVFQTEGLASMRKFMDVERSSFLFVKEEVVIGTAGEGDPSARTVIYLRRRPGLSDEEFTGAFRRHAAIARRVPGLIRYAQHFPISDTGIDTGEDNYDAAEILAWDNLEELEEVWASDSVQKEMLGSLATFCDLARSGLIVAEAKKVK